MNETRWINLSGARAAPPVHPKDAAWSLESPSIYDVPSQVRARYSPATGHLTVEFRYLETEQTEQTESSTLSEYLRARIGKRSRRIWSIEFDIHGYNRDTIQIAQAAEASIEKLTDAKQENRIITSQVVHRNSASLFGAKHLSLA
jgi:hypothetical protein